MTATEVASRTPYWHEYADSYTAIDVTGRVVLDIGADCGSSAVWFIQHGAKRVVCYSLEEQQCHDERIEWHGEWKGEYILADVLKVDCEGCECMLTPEVIEKYEQWYIAVHTFAPCYGTMKAYLLAHGKLIYMTPDRREELYGHTKG